MTFSDYHFLVEHDFIFKIIFLTDYYSNKQKDLSLKLKLPPKSFGPHMKQILRSKLIEDVEGTCTGQFGYIICVMDGMKIDIGKGRIIPGDGSAEFEVKYSAIVWRPFKGEVVDGVVTKVNNLGFFVDVGPLSVFISVHVSTFQFFFQTSYTELKI